MKIEGDNEPRPTIPREEGQVPFVFVGTMDSISNAKLLLEYHLAHLKVNLESIAVFHNFYLKCNEYNCHFYDAKIFSISSKYVYSIYLLLFTKYNVV